MKDKSYLSYLKRLLKVQFKIIQTNLVMSYNGIPTQKYTLPRAIDRLPKQADVHRIRLHALRHSHAFLLISMGENPLIIKEQLGHEDIETTVRTYGPLSQ